MRIERFAPDLHRLCGCLECPVVMRSERFTPDQRRPLGTSNALLLNASSASRHVCAGFASNTADGTLAERERREEPAQPGGAWFRSSRSPAGFGREEPAQPCGARCFARPLVCAAVFSGGTAPWPRAARGRRPSGLPRALSQEHSASESVWLTDSRSAREPRVREVAHVREYRTITR